MNAHHGIEEQIRIRETLEARDRALLHRDPDALLAPCTDDIVCFDLAPPLQQSSEPGEAREMLTRWFATWKGPIRSERRELAIEVDGALAVARSLDRMLGTKTDGEQVDLWYRATRGLRKQDGRWRIAHEHLSVPFYMDGSLRAAVDLKP
jgi:ketosteroid isomerase-like protein